MDVFRWIFVGLSVWTCAGSVWWVWDAMRWGR